MVQLCCEWMTDQINWVCDQHDDRFDCPDALIDYVAKFDEYGIIVHDGGRSKVSLRFCPWCGQRLPASQRDRWFDELEEAGIDIETGEIPSQYLDSTWWRRPAEP